jgi:hypothetical protein
MKSIIHPLGNKPNKFIKSMVDLAQISEVNMPVLRGQFFYYSVKS